MNRSALKTTTARAALAVTVMLGFCCGLFPVAAAEDYTNADYAKNPPFISREVRPNVIIAMDISGSMKAVAYRDVAAGQWHRDTTIHDDFDGSKVYYGYFEPSEKYVYDTSKQFFKVDTDGTTDGDEWDGNFLNWMAMRRIDVARKVVVGGKVSVKTLNQQTLADGTTPHPNNGIIVPVNRYFAKRWTVADGFTDWQDDWDGWYILEGQNEPSDRTFRKRFATSNTDGLTPAEYADNTTFLMANGQILPQASSGGDVMALGPEVEVGRVTLDWQRDEDENDPEPVWVPFLQSYNQPRVVIKSPTYNGADPMADTRIQFGADTDNDGDGDRSVMWPNAAGSGVNGFWVYMDEWDYRDVYHTAETIGYIVVDADPDPVGVVGDPNDGTHNGAADGWIQVEMDSGDVWRFQAVRAAYAPASGRCGKNTANLFTVFYNSSAAQKPIALTQVATFGTYDDRYAANDGLGRTTSDDDALATRNDFDGLNDLSRFYMLIQEQESNMDGSGNCTHAVAENISVILIDPPNGAAGAISSDDFGGTTVQAGVKTGVNHQWHTLTYDAANPFADAPAFIADQQTIDGSDPAIVRVGGANQTNDGSAIEMLVQEEKSDDSETGHNGASGTGEDIGWLAVEFVSGFKIRVGVTEEPEGIIQDISDTMRIGMVAYNYDHTKNPTGIYDGNKVHGGTFIPAFPDASLPPDEQTNYDISLSCGVHDPVENTIAAIELHPLIWGTTPIAETLVEVMRYVQHNNGNYADTWDGWYDDESTNAVFPFSSEDDPFFYDDVGASGQLMECAKTFVLHFNDGEPYRDWDNNPAVTHPNIGDPDGDSDQGINEMLDDVALYIRKNDMRTDLSGHQEIISYYVFAALGEAEAGSPTQEAREAAANGGFEDLDNDREPDVAHKSTFTNYINTGNCPKNEWDQDEDGNPDTFFFASDGYELVDDLMAAFQSILQRTSSGTAASVISNSRSGEGAIYQSLFYPSFNDTDGNKVEWVGQVHSLFVDAYGNVREDTNGNARLDPAADKFIVFDDEGATVEKYADANGDGQFTSDEKVNPDSGTISDLAFLWNSSEWLNEMSDANATTQRAYGSPATQRYIFTFLDTDADMIVDSGEQAAFTESNKAAILPYIHLYPWLQDGNTAPTYIEAARVACEADSTQCAAFNDFLARQSARVVNYIRGEDQAAYTSSSHGYTIPAMRSRQVDYDEDGTVETWRKGDVVNSTPTLVTVPAEDYDLIYNDSTYATFVNQYIHRRNVVYLGGNDGMFHAYNAGFYDRSDKSFDLQTTSGGEAQHALGAELWAYIPYNLLPHLYWLTDPDYAHVYYSDLKPKIFDAKIFTADTTHPGGWGTILVGGMRFGGGKIAADMVKTDGLAFNAATDRYMTSAFFILDITDPESPPVVLAEVTLEGLGYTTCYPAVIPIRDRTVDGNGQVSFGENEWYLVFGNGPTGSDGPDYESLTKGTSRQDGKLFVLDLKRIVQNDEICMVKSDGTCHAAGDADKSFATIAAPSPTAPDDDSGVFISDPVTVDWNIDFNTDTVYFGTVIGTYDDDADTLSWGGKMHRLVTYNDPAPVDWNPVGTVIDLTAGSGSTSLPNGQPIFAAPSLGLDTAGNRWLFFGTGRFLSREDAYNSDIQSYYGVKESELDKTSGAWDTADRDTDLLDVTDVKVFEGGSTVETTISGVGDFSELKAAVSAKKGWYRDLQGAKERNLGQAVLFGDILTFTTYNPSIDPCAFEGESNLYALSFLTGTAFSESVIGTDSTVTHDPGGGADPLEMVDLETTLGKGLSITPNIHTGREEGTRAFVQTSTGAILVVEQANPGTVKSGTLSWEEEAD